MKKILAMLALIGVSILLLNYTAYAGWGDPPIEPDDGEERTIVIGFGFQ